ncbi:HNH endonuclease signature motif containing protein [Paenibacillus sp. 1P07SE]|uniref:HNH endonuclease signature motif containing protein n=1 Tax=Paenibacillus sp. 1P07SE TaxID=3132209 RepID=UPI0039A4FBDB
MSISDKARKILWGKSGNRCSICKRILVIDATEKDDMSIIGDECHIVSGQVNGPRYNPEYNKEIIDSYENLILLCRVHHKMVDDQQETYTASILLQMKENHEKWVSEKLNEEKVKKQPVRVRRIKENLPEILMQITSGKEIINIVDGVMGYGFDYEEPKNELDIALISGFLQTVQDYGEILSEFESGERVRIGYELTKMINELAERDYLVFGFKEMRIIEGGNSDSENWPVAIINIKHQSSSEIIKINLQDLKSDNNHNLHK